MGKGIFKIMGTKLLNQLKHYGVFIFLPLAIALFLATYFIGNFFKIPAYIIFAGIWFISLFIYERNTIYYDKTGRSYIYDHRKYNRTFFELIDYFHDADPHRLDPQSFKKEYWKEANGIIFGTTDDGRLIKIPSNTECNIFVAGMMGSSKTTGVVIPTCLQYGGSILAVDIKGDIYNACHNKRKILRFCPDLTDENGKNIALENSCSFNPFNGVSKMTTTEKKLYISNIAMTLIPDDGGSDGNYFTSRARKLFIGIVYYLMDKKADITFPEVLHAIIHQRQPNGFNMKNFPKTVFDWVIAISESDCMVAIEQVSSLIGNNEKNISGAFDSLTTALTPFSNEILDVLLSGKGHCISLKDFEQGSDFFLQISQKNLDVYSPIFTMIITSLMNSFMDRPDSSVYRRNRPILIILDEFPQLTFSYKQMNAVLSTLRSKSVQSMLISQNVSQMAHKFQNDGWRAILGNCNFQLILKSNDALTQKHFSTLFGTRKVLKISNSDTDMASMAPKQNLNRTVQETREPIYQPEDFGDLGRKMCIYFNGKRIEANKIKSWE